VISLGEQRHPSGKVIIAYAVQGDVDLSGFRSNTFTMECPRDQGRSSSPEMDRAEWMSVERATQKLIKGQVPILHALREQVQSAPDSGTG
jgi:predicted NUDIX family NTP pyrophosphohydrolase